MADQKMHLRPTRLRQIALVCRNLQHARQQLTEILGVPVVYVDPAVAQWGLENILVSIGGEIIEVVAPTQDGTTAGRLLDRRGEGGYMIIMQTDDADAQRKSIEADNKAKVIFSHPFSNSYSSWNGIKDEGHCFQYHLKGIKGGMMPELDSHVACSQNQDPVNIRFSPWHPCGKEYERYVDLMKQTSHLHLLGCSLRLAPNDEDVKGAARQWSDMFGIPVTRDELAFTNSRISFLPGEKGNPEGLQSITIGVESRSKLDGILNRARESGLWRAADGSFLMLGVMWQLVLLSDTKARL